MMGHSPSGRFPWCLALRRLVVMTFCALDAWIDRWGTVRRDGARRTATAVRSRATAAVPAPTYAGDGEATQERARHQTVHPLTGKTVRLRFSREDQNIRTGDLFRVWDWWDRISIGPWITAAHDRAAAKYTVRSEATGPPADGEIVCGQIGGVGYLVHVRELGPALPTYAVG